MSRRAVTISGWRTCKSVEAVRGRANLKANRVPLDPAGDSSFFVKLLSPNGIGGRPRQVTRPTARNSWI